MAEGRMCPILTTAQAVLLARRDDATLDNCWQPCTGESCAMYERCVPTMLALATTEQTTKDIVFSLSALEKIIAPFIAPGEEYVTQEQSTHAMRSIAYDVYRLLEDAGEALPPFDPCRPQIVEFSKELYKDYTGVELKPGILVQGTVVEKLLRERFGDTLIGFDDYWYDAKRGLVVAGGVRIRPFGAPKKEEADDELPPF